MRYPLLILCRTAAILVSLVSTSAALAGGWSSIGGELFEASMNPWFVQRGNGTHRLVRYCVEADEANFGLTRTQLEAHVQSALDFWVDELGSAYLPENRRSNAEPVNQVLVGKESFVPVATCDDSVQIRFQFGVLTTAQETSFHDQGIDPKRFVALAVRTEYDEATLQSKGFVYIAPPRGPLGMSTPDLNPNPWNVDGQRRLFSVLSHELGHVFGLQHTGSYDSLMGAGLPEFAVAQTTALFSGTRSIFKLPYGATLQKICYSGDGIPAFIARFFGAPADARCLGIRLHADRFEVVTARDEQDRVQTIGTAPFDTAETITSYEPMIRVWLPDTQQVFPNVPAYLGRILAGPEAVRRQVTATYKNRQTSEARRLYLHLAPEQIQVGALWNDAIILDVFQHRETETSK